MGMQGRPGDQSRIFSAVEKIPGKRAANGRHMNADLMGAAGLQAQAHQCPFRRAVQNLVFRPGNAACGAYFLADDRVPCVGQRQINYAVRLFRRAVAHSQVFAPERVGVQGAAQNILGVGMFGYCHYAGGAFVQPVHRVEIGWDAAAIVISQQKTAQRIVPMAQSGMDGIRNDAQMGLQGDSSGLASVLTVA